MLPCVLIGDSIAYGVGLARPECETVAQVGITSARYVTQLLPPRDLDADLVVISLGVNDDGTVETADNLRTVRARMSARRVVWLLPNLKENVRATIRTVAAEYGDRLLDTRGEVGPDRLHPTGAGYEHIAATLIGPASGVEVAYAPADTEDRRPVRLYATPAERIKRLRSIRQSEIRHPAPAGRKSAARPSSTRSTPARGAAEIPVSRKTSAATPSATLRRTASQPPRKPADATLSRQSANHPVRVIAPQGRATMVVTCSGLGNNCASKARKYKG